VDLDSRPSDGRVQSMAPPSTVRANRHTVVWGTPYLVGRRRRLRFGSSEAHFSNRNYDVCVRCNCDGFDGAAGYNLRFRQIGVVKSGYHSQSQREIMWR
jgi:hypothetical protein